MSTDAAIESEIQAKGLTAPRVTPAMIQAAIVGEYYFMASQGAGVGSHSTQPIAADQYLSLSLLTLCVLVLRNGFTVTGESACASPANFNADIGRKVARQNAEAKIWPLEGYLLKQRLSELAMTDAKVAAQLLAQQ